MKRILPNSGLYIIAVPLIIRWLITMVLLWSLLMGAALHGFAQTAIYSEDFSSYVTGTTTSELWSISLNGALPTTFAVGQGSFDARGTMFECHWISSEINIASYQDVSLSMGLTETGNMSVLLGDYIKVYYKLDGGTETLVETNGHMSGNFSPAVASQDGLSGNTLQIIVKVKNTGISKYHSIDNILVSGYKLDVTGVVTNINCSGDTAGSIDVTVLNGTPPYSYVWSGGETSEDITGVTAGIYNITVTDQSGLSTPATFEVLQPDSLYLSANVSGVSCNGSANGSINVTVNGGTMPVRYTWSNGEKKSNLNNLAPGVYSVTVRDINNCTVAGTYNVTEPDSLVLQLDGTNISCNGTDGAIDATVGGGTIPYSYSWSDNSTSEDLDSLPIGGYALTVTDANNCTVSANMQLTGTAPLQVHLQKQNLSCLGCTNGSVNSVVTGGTSPYAYQWSIGETEEDISGLAEGIYYITVTDANACIVVDSVGVVYPVCSFISNGPAYWNSASNWDCNRVPTVEDAVFIPSDVNKNPRINVDAVINDFIIGAGANVEIIGPRSVTVKGDCEINGDFVGGTGTFIFGGDSLQRVRGAGPLDFYNVTINNSSNEGVHLEEDLVVRGKLNLIKGDLVTGDNIVELTDAEGLGAYSDSSYVVGAIKRKLAALDQSDYYFPVGYGGKGNYFPAYIKNDLLSGINYLTVSFGPVVNHRDEDLWEINNTDVEYSSLCKEGIWTVRPDNQPLLGSYTMYLCIKNIQGLVDNQFGILKRPEGSDGRSWSTGGGLLPELDAYGRKATHTYAKRIGLTSFSEFGVGGDGGALPIELMEFNVELDNDRVNINWSCATEIDNSYFTIERSADGEVFEEIDIIAGAGNSVELTTYSTVDYEPLPGLSYYRLKQTDYDGKFTYSKVEAVLNKGASNEVLSVYPNPSDGIFTIDLSNVQTDVDIAIYDLNGRIRYSIVVPQYNGKLTNKIDVRDKLSSGHYIVKVSAGEDKFMYKVIIE